MRRYVNQALISAGSLLILLAALVALDDRVRDKAAIALGAGRSAEQLASVAQRFGTLMIVILDAARDQSLEHAPLMIFALVGFVLVLALWRT